MNKGLTMVPNQISIGSKFVIDGLIYDNLGINYLGENNKQNYMEIPLDTILQPNNSYLF